MEGSYTKYRGQAPRRKGKTGGFYPSTILRLAWLDWLDAGDGVPLLIALPADAGGLRTTGWTTISRFALGRGEFERLSRMRSEPVGLAMPGGERVLRGARGIPGPDVRPPWCPMGRGWGWGGSIVGRAGDPASVPCLSSGECDVGCWRNGMGEGRVDEDAAMAEAATEGEDIRRDMLPTRDRFASFSSGPGLSGRLVLVVLGGERPIPECFDIMCWGIRWASGGERIGPEGGIPKLRGSLGPP